MQGFINFINGYIDRNLTVIIDGMGVEDLIDSVAANLGNIQIVD